MFWWCILFCRNTEEGMKESCRSGESRLAHHTRSACNPRLAQKRHIEKPNVM